MFGRHGKPIGRLSAIAFVGACVQFATPTFVHASTLAHYGRAIASRTNTSAPLVSVAPHEVGLAGGTVVMRVHVAAHRRVFVSATPKVPGFPKLLNSTRSGITLRARIPRAQQGSSDLYQFAFSTPGDSNTAIAVVFVAQGALSGREAESATSTRTDTLVNALSAPVIASQPDDTEAFAGQLVILQAALQAGITASVQWLESRDSGLSWSVIPGATATSYRFIADPSDNGALFKALFSNERGTTSTNVVSLTVLSSQTQNWSGYVALGHAVTAVSAAWTVPAVTCVAGERSYAGVWIGIDGADPHNPTVEQVGTASDCANGSPAYGAWYELYGDRALSGGSSVPLPPLDVIKPGDVVSASVAVTNGTWTFSLTDNTEKWSFSTAIAFAGPSLGSAEWIVERPTLSTNGTTSMADLADFGSVSFTNLQATLNGTTAAAGSLDVAPMTMIGASGSPLETTGSLEQAGSAFAEQWLATN
jgi:hypothetical protein